MATKANRGTLLLTLLAVSAVAWAEGGAAGKAAPIPFFCPRTSAAPVVDGVVQEGVWETAPVRYPALPGGLSPLHPAEVRMLWDEEALYVAFECADADVRSTIDERDGLLYEDGDVFEMFLVLGGGAPKKIELEVNPRGALLDVLHDGQVRADWNWKGAQWRSHVRGTLNDDVRDGGWSAELKLPWLGLSEFGISKPADVRDARVLFLVVDRIALDGDRFSREMKIWPVLSALRLTLHEEYAPLSLVTRPATGLTEGYRRMVKGQARRLDSLSMDYRGLSAYREYDSEAADSVMVWETHPLPADLPERVRIAFVGQCHSKSAPGTPERASFDLLVNGRVAVRFSPYTPRSETWEGPEARLEFKHQAGQWWPSGIFVLTAPSAWFEGSVPARLEVRRAGAGPRTRFSIKAWTDTVLYEESLHPNAGR